MRIRGRSDDGQVVKWSGERQMNVKSQSELDIGGRETCFDLRWPKPLLSLYNSNN